MRLSEIPRQKKMLYAPFLNVLLHCLAFFFFFFLHLRNISIGIGRLKSSLYITSSVFFWAYLLFLFLTSVSSLKSQHNVLLFLPLPEQEKCRKASYRRYVADISADSLLQIRFLRPGFKCSRLLLCQHSLMSLCLVTTIQRTAHLEKTDFGSCKSRGVRRFLSK